MADDAKPRPIADDELYIERIFAAPAQLVFDMWSQGRHMIHWMGPANARCLAADLDFRVGGEWSAHIRMPAHGDAHMGGRYVEIGNISPGLTYEADPALWVVQNVTIIGNNHYGRRHLRDALELLRRARQRYPFDRIVSHRFPLDQADAAYRLFDTQTTGKSVLLV